MSGGRRRVLLTFFFLLFSVGMFWTVQKRAWAMGDALNVENVAEQKIGQESGTLFSGDELTGMDEIEEYLRQQLGGSSKQVTFRELMKALASGDTKTAASFCLEGLRQQLFGELRGKKSMVASLLALGFFGAVFTGFSEVLSGDSTVETGFFLTYLMMFAVLAAAFRESAETASRILSEQVQFMKVLLPSYFTAVVWSGAGLASAAWYEVALFLITGVQQLYGGLLIPLVRVYFLSVMAGSMIKEDLCSRMLDLLKTGICWGSRSLLGVVLGFQLIQGMVLPYADSVKHAGMQRLLQAVPGIGEGAGALARLMLGSGVLIKNTMGAAAVILLLVCSIVPLTRLFVMYLIYRTIAALLQPVADKRLISCLSGVAEAQKMLLTAAASGLLLFAVTIALICQGTNVVYLAS